MKKSAAGAALAAAVGFSVLSMTPAMAAPVFQNCTEAESAGYGVLIEGAPGYSLDLDSDRDGRACEANGPGTGLLNPQVPVTPVPPVNGGTVTDGVFDNCTEARAAGAVNIPASDPRYGLHLDRDRDGFGCDADGTDDGVQTEVIIDWVPESWNTGAGQYSQMGQVPAGAADTGVAVEDGAPAGGLALGGGLALAAAAGAAVVVRRRAARS